MDRKERKLMSVEEWQRRLEDTFRSDGVIGFELLNIIDAEKQYGRDAIKYFSGYRVLQDSFQGFFVETLRLASRKINELHATDGANIISSAFSFALYRQFHNFRGLRAAENLFLCGYPYAGYSLFRDLTDRAIFMLALMQGLTTPDALFGVDDEIREMMLHVGNNEREKREVLDKATKNRKIEERRISNLILGKGSGLSDSTREELNVWRDLFHSEVHGGKLSFADSVGPLKYGGAMSIGPELKDNQDKSAANYMNRSNEIGWMFHRTLPGIQLQTGSFGKEWAEKWIILDESFRVMIAGLGIIGKDIAFAIEELIDSKFTLRPESSCFTQKIES